MTWRATPVRAGAMRKFRTLCDRGNGEEVGLS